MSTKRSWVRISFTEPNFCSFGNVKLHHGLNNNGTYQDSATFQFFKILSYNPGTRPGPPVWNAAAGVRRPVPRAINSHPTLITSGVATNYAVYFENAFDISEMCIKDRIFDYRRGSANDTRGLYSQCSDREFLTGQS